MVNPPQPLSFPGRKFHLESLYGSDRSLLFRSFPTETFNTRIEIFFYEVHSLSVGTSLRSPRIEEQKNETTSSNASEDAVRQFEVITDDGVGLIAARMVSIDQRNVPSAAPSVFYPPAPKGGKTGPQPVGKLRDVAKILGKAGSLPGLCFYGIQKPPASEANPPDVWPEGVEYAERWISHESSGIVAWSVVFQRWPTADAFPRAVHETLDALLGLGCVAAWVGDDVHMSFPPYLFDREDMSGQVLAAKLADGRSWVDLDPEKPYSPLPDEVMDVLRDATKGLSDVGHGYPNTIRSV